MLSSGSQQKEGNFFLDIKQQARLVLYCVRLSFRMMKPIVVACVFVALFVVQQTEGKVTLYQTTISFNKSFKTNFFT
jgi:hypothetical protein